MHARALFDGLGGLLAELSSQWEPSNLLDIAELYWWSTDDAVEHRTFLSALLKRVTASAKTSGDEHLITLLQSVFDHVQQASASVKAAGATCLSSWFIDHVEEVDECCTAQLRPVVLHSALLWLYTMHCGQWQESGDISTASAFRKLKTIYMQHLLKEKQYEQVLQLVHASKEQFAQLASTTASPDLHAQLTCILSMQHSNVWLQLQSALSSTELPTREQLRTLLPLLVENVNAWTLHSQGKVCPHSSITFKSSQLQARSIAVAE